MNEIVSGTQQNNRHPPLEPLTMCKPTNIIMEPNYPFNLTQHESLLFLSRASRLSAFNITSVLENQSPRAQSTANDTPATRQAGFLTERQHCLLFIKLLFKYLSKTNMAALQRRAKTVVAQCIRRSQQPGNQVALVESLDQELRNCVGEIHWNRTKRLYSAYCANQNLRVSQAV